MLQTQILKLVKALSPETLLPSGWDKDLPQYAALELSGPSLILARCGTRRYVLSVVVRDTVRSMLVSSELTDAEISTVQAFYNELSESGASGAPPRDAQPTGLDSASSSGPRLGPIPLRPAQQDTRDPNAPPGFEDEHRLGEPRPVGPSIDFDPDQDIYPPGGRHPQLRPLAPFGGGSPGMMPSPFGSSKPPNIREDPPFPFSGGGGFGPL